jgi:hypothetical protein
MAGLAVMDFPDCGAVLDLDVACIHGSEAVKYSSDPDIQVHACDLGCHIEMSTKPGVGYPVGWTSQPGRYVLPQMIITPDG